MKPIILLDSAKTPDGQELKLFSHDRDFSIKVGTVELMNSRMHGSEEALAELACRQVALEKKIRVLIGGLGMGFSLRAALENLPEDAEVVVSELVPEVVKWNRETLGHLANNPLNDKRVTVREEDVVKTIKDARSDFNAILLDVDNGPQRLFQKGNDKLYNLKGLFNAGIALRPRGVLGVWSSGPDKEFTKRLVTAGFHVEEKRVHARAGSKAGGYHLIWLARK